MRWRTLSLDAPVRHLHARLAEVRDLLVEVKLALEAQRRG